MGFVRSGRTLGGVKVAFFGDLEPCTYFGRWEQVLLAIGWLEAGREFSKGPVPDEVFATLVHLLVDPWQPVASAGRGACSLCRFSDRPAHLSYGGSTIVLGASNLFVPSTSHVFVAPSMIAHYMDAHEYCPPEVFQQAVLRCPEMKSPRYLREVKVLGLIG
jgi:hypothetical protein